MAAIGHFTGDKICLVLGLLFEQMTEAQVATTLRHIPDAVREMWAATGSRDFVTMIQGVRG